MAKENTPKVQPKAKFRVGAVTATVWENTGTKDGKTWTNRSVKLQRSYKDAKDQWQQTDNLAQNDIPKAILALNKAYEFLTIGVKESKEQQLEDEE